MTPDTLHTYDCQTCGASWMLTAEAASKGCQSDSPTCGAPLRMRESDGAPRRASLPSILAALSYLSRGE